MQGDIEYLLNRREFNKLVLLSIAGAGFASSSTSQARAEEPKAPTILEIPGLSFEVQDWKPTDITDKVIAAFEKAEYRIWDGPDFFTSLKYARKSGSGEWWIDHVIPSRRRGESDTRSITQYLGHDNGTYFLFDSGSKRIFALPDGESCFSSPELISDNGAYNGDKFIVDLNNSRKVIAKGEGTFRLAGKGNAAVIDLGDDGFHVFDMNSLKVSYSGKGDLMAIDHDASVLVYNRDNGYHRADLKTGKENEMFHQNLTHFGFELSPDGNFCVANMDQYGPTYLHVYVHSTGERFEIRAPKIKEEKDYTYASDNVSSIDNDGTVHAKSGNYHYGHGNYSYGGLFEFGPRGLKIIREDSKK